MKDLDEDALARRLFERDAPQTLTWRGVSERVREEYRRVIRRRLAQLEEALIQYREGEAHGGHEGPR